MEIESINTVSFHYNILVNRCISNFENYKKNRFQIMSLPVQLIRPATAAISDSAVPSPHDSKPKVYVACWNVAVQTEEIHGEEIREAEVVHDGDIYLKVFYNDTNIYGEVGSPDYDDEEYWLHRHARQKPFFSDLSDDEYETFEEDFNSIYHLHSPMDPKSVVWRKCATAKLIDDKDIYANAVSGLQACDIAVQTVLEQVGDDSFYTDEDLFIEIVDNAIITDDDNALFADDIVEWDN